MSNPAEPLLGRVAAGDPAAVRACIARYGGLVLSIARRLSPSRAEAEDAAQEIFVDLWRSASRFDASISSETTFVAVIARRRLLDRRRRRARRPETEPLSETPLAKGGGGTEPSQIEACGEAVLAAKALAQLRPEQRHVLLLSTCQGMSHDEIATETGLPLGTVKAHARRGLLRVRELLGGAAALEAR
ncbi:MAG TPA: sigma-70 family RNA polymerase sigma factor [Minicystis sp.]|nr:sigma-70 family RNA polymerase sigma factor [Minicystis sp.]